MQPSDVKQLLVLGAGFTGAELVRRAQAQGTPVVATVRRAEQVAALCALGAEALLLESLDESIRAHVDVGTHVVVTFPPDGSTDARIAPWLATAGAITYISSTGVYDSVHGHIDDSTPLPSPTPSTAPRLAAEAEYRRYGACVLRCPGIYGAERGLHRRLLLGEYSLPGDGTDSTSRIHVADLATFVFQSVLAPGETFVVGDLEPAAQRDVVSWICATYGVPFPSSAPRESVHRTLRANRAIDSSRARRLLNVDLRYPTFRDGMKP
ncbi:MAG: hypothetical protein QM756_15635 [Polyangiaceae bacterium]